MKSTRTLEDSESFSCSSSDELDEQVYNYVPSRSGLNIEDKKRVFPSIEWTRRKSKREQKVTPKKSLDDQKGFLARVKNTFSLRRNNNNNAAAAAAASEKKVEKSTSVEVESLEESLKAMEEFLTLLQKSPNGQKILQEQMVHALKENKQVQALGTLGERDAERRQSCMNRAA